MVHMWNAPSYEWWLPLDGTGNPWYFWTPRSRGHSGSVKIDYETVDEDMRDLVKHLHSLGIRTLPSCTGHRHDPKGLEERLKSIDACANLIRGPGILFENIETQSIGFHRNPGWVPPDKSELLQRALSESMVGYIGLIDPEMTGMLGDMNRYVKHQRHCGPALTRDARGDVLDFTVISPNWKSQAKFWEELTRYCLEHLR